MVLRNYQFIYSLRDGTRPRPERVPGLPTDARFDLGSDCDGLEVLIFDDSSPIHGAIVAIHDGFEVV